MQSVRSLGYALLYEITCIMVKFEMMCNAIVTGASVQMKVSQRNAVLCSSSGHLSPSTAAQFQHSSRDLT